MYRLLPLRLGLQGTLEGSICRHGCCSGCRAHVRISGAHADDQLDQLEVAIDRSRSMHLGQPEGPVCEAACLSPVLLSQRQLCAGSKARLFS
jgi:hypothetical protein